MSREVPEGWQLGKLGSFVEEFKVLDSAGDLPPLSVTKSSGIVLQSEKFNKRIANASSRNYKVIRSGEYSYDPMSLYYGAIGRLSVCDAGIVSPAYITFRLKGAIERGFFDLYVKTSDFLVEVNKVTTGGNQDGKRKKTDWNSFCRLPILLPPLHEQRRIAEILASVDDAIAATRAVIEQTRKVKQGILDRLLTKGKDHTRFKRTEIGEIPEGWELKRLRDLAIHITSGSRGWAQYYSDEGELFLRSQNVRNGSLDLSDKQFVTIPKSAEASRTLVQADDLVFTITGNSVGNIARIPADLGDAYVSQHVALVRLRDRQLAPFLEAFFSPSGPGNHQILNAQYGQSKPGLSLENVRSFHVPVPPHHELAQLSEIVKDHSDYEMNVATELSHLISLKSALMSDLLTGRKRVTDALPMAAE